MTEYQGPWEPPRKKGPGNWVWLVLAVAIVSVIGAAIFALGTVLENMSNAPPSKYHLDLPPAVPHVDEGVFLSPAYADGAREVSMRVGESANFVGASVDSSIVAIEVDDLVQGIDAGAAEVVWTYPSYACSLGSWDGVALCVDADDAFEATLGDAPDVVGLDLSTGTPTFRFTLDDVPKWMTFIGTDDNHAYFTVQMDGTDEENILALTPDGAVAWMTPLGQHIFGAALASEDKIVVSLAGAVTVLGRSTGEITFTEPVGEETVSLLWDGWTLYESDAEKPHKVFDLTGDLVEEHQFADTYIPAGSVGDVPSAVYERQALNGGKRTDRHVWAVTRDGQRVASSAPSGIVDSQLDYILKGQSHLLGLSADGSLLLTNKGMGTIVDARNGEVIGGLAESDVPMGTSIVDGIVYYTWLDRIVMLLPGAANK